MHYISTRGVFSNGASHRILYVLILCVFLFLPQISNASIIINEVAWMGSSVSSNDEWIELKNTGSGAVDLSGYTLTSLNGSLHLTLSGSISGSGYFLLERTDDSTVPNVVADQIYSGSLTNAGDSLTLKNQSGSIIDSISGGENWQNIGGDNTTKDTAQRTESGWVTAVPTPRRDNATSGTTPTPTPSTSNSSGAASTPKSSASSAKQNEIPEDPSMTVSAGGDRTGLIGSDISFSATAYGKEKKPIGNANYTWTFGDGTSKEGTHVLHQYSIPGDYAVMVNVGNIDSKTMVTDRIIVHVREASFTLTKNSEGSLTLANQDTDDIDIGGFILTGSQKQFTIPLHTIILGEGFIRFMPSILGFSGSEQSTLLYPSGAVATRIEISENAPSNQLPAGMVSGKIADLPAKDVSSSPIQVSRTAVEVDPVPEKGSAKVSEEKTPPQAELAAGAGNSISDSGKSSSFLLWFLLLVGLLGSAIAAVIIVRRQPIEALLTADDFSVVEETDPLV